MLKLAVMSVAREITTKQVGKMLAMFVVEESIRRFALRLVDKGEQVLKGRK